MHTLSQTWINKIHLQTIKLPHPPTLCLRSVYFTVSNCIWEMQGQRWSLRHPLGCHFQAERHAFPMSVQVGGCHSCQCNTLHWGVYAQQLTSSEIWAFLCCSRMQNPQHDTMETALAFCLGTRDLATATLLGYRSRNISSKWAALDGKKHRERRTSLLSLKKNVS